MAEAKLERTENGLAPQTDGWFVLNARDAPWGHADELGEFCAFESRDHPFPQLGINLNVLARGQPMAMYHREDRQEDFLVLSGECIAVVEGDERRLRTWDLLHCPAGIAHVIVGAGEKPSLVLAVGARREGDEGLFYPADETARKYGAAAEADTPSPQEAYARFAKPAVRAYRQGDLPDP